MSNDEMNISEFFDPYNDEHIKAYVYLTKNGFWPENFIPENCKMSNIWQLEVMNKMVDAWVKYKKMK